MTERLKRIVCGACDLYCGLLAHVDVAKNQVVQITANPGHPLMPNSICRIGTRGMDYVSHPDRLLHPRRRVGERGSGAWEEVGWEEALDDIAARLRRIVEEDGPEAVSSSIGAGGTIAHAPSIWRAMATGEPYRVRAFIAAGNNTLMSYSNTKAIYEGLTRLDLLVVMDFFMTPTAQIADYALPRRPGSSGRRSTRTTTLPASTTRASRPSSRRRTAGPTTASNAGSRCAWARASTGPGRTSRNSTTIACSRWA